MHHFSFLIPLRIKLILMFIILMTSLRLSIISIVIFRFLV